MAQELSPEEAKELGSFGTPVISDTQGKHFNMHPRIKPVYPMAKVYGPALTVRSPICDNLTFHKAIEMAQEGDVIVVDSRGYINAGLFGEVMAVACQVKKIAGVVIDGACRDAAILEEMDFPTFSAGINPGGTVKETLGPINVQISCGGVPVNPGDFIIGDRDGVCVIPKGTEKAVLEKAREVPKKEAIWLEEMRKGRTNMDVLGFNEILKKKGLL